MEKQSYTGIDYYDSYCEYVKDNPLYQVDYKIFRAIINDYFKHLRDELIEQGKEIKLPCRLGTLQIVKRKPNSFTGKSLRIDYGTSKKMGKLILYDNAHCNYYKYRVYWSKLSMLTHNKTHYQLILTRDNKRHLAQIIKNRVRDYIELP